MRVDKENEILIGHDTYLKIWQLSNPRLDDIYDVIYLDEAQDSNPCLLDVLYKQTCRLVFVGDQYQSIYSWRGAVNAKTTDGGKEWHNCLLSTSFRYGKSIADIANKVLNIPVGTDLSVKGVKPQDKVVNHYGAVNMLDGQVHTRIYRTNHNLLSDAIVLVTNNVKCSIELDLTDFIKMLESALALYQNRMNDVKHDSVAPYMSWEEFVMDADNKLVTTIVSSGQAQNVISVLRLHRNNPKPVVTLTTAHKSKGREWDTVWLNNDFPDVSVANGKPSFVSDEERNLMYVAATRAKHTLYYNRTISRII
jgi:superfamily I DNA/RNA helicase